MHKREGEKNGTKFASTAKDKGTKPKLGQDTIELATPLAYSTREPASCSLVLSSLLYSDGSSHCNTSK